MAVVEVNCKNLKRNPQCPHGPTLKFVRMNGNHKTEFFACSTYRDRKDCAFYLEVGDKLTDKIKHVWNFEREKILQSVDHKSLQKRLSEVKRSPPTERLYCHTCSQLDITSRKNNHKSHEVQLPLSDKVLSHPSKILMPKKGNKKEAQYLFSPNSVKVIVDNLQRAKVTRVVCVGTPRIHEHIQSLENGKMDSILLDMDHRYHSFWPKEKFVWFNMFNQHFFSVNSDEARKVVQEFMSSGDQEALVVDPPFGGHVDPLAATIKHFINFYSRTNSGKELKVIWVFPYFREKHITQRLPDFKMLDYKVEYDNHKDYSGNRKLGSPARLFSNMDPSQFKLPKEEGYHYCSLCRKWVSPENKHCKKCNTCTSKDGRTYRHCDDCGKCVKPKWQHCGKCQACHMAVEGICYSQEETSPNENIEPRHKKIKRIQQLLTKKGNKILQ